MKTNIVNRVYEDKYNTVFRQIINNNDIDDLKSYLEGHKLKSGRHRKKPSIKFLTWLLQNKSFNNDVAQIIHAEIKNNIEQNRVLKNRFMEVKSRTNICEFFKIKEAKLNYILYVLSDYEKYIDFKIPK